jgi:hypothetical protein
MRGPRSALRIDEAVPAEICGIRHLESTPALDRASCIIRLSFSIREDTIAIRSCKESACHLVIDRR